jgi:hypothetical protein
MPRAGLRLGRGYFARGEGGCPGCAARLSLLQAASLGQAGLRRSEGEGGGCWAGSASSRVSAHSQFCYLKFLFFFQIYL